MAGEVTAALITAGVASTAVVVNAFFTFRNFQKQRELEKFKVDMQMNMSRKNALTAYQYEAIKRLYSECEPVFFQMSEASELSIKYCKILCKKNFYEKLVPERDNRDKNNGFWMMCRSSELISALYAILSPMAFFCILREKMTIVDCSLDPTISFRYRVARQLLLSFHEDVDIAHLPPAIDYDPMVTDWRTKRLEKPAKYWWQGATPGRLDKAIRMLIASDGERRRVISFGEFEDLYNQTFNGADRDKQKTIGVAANALYGFTPIERPVFWRIITIHAHLHRVLITTIPDQIGSTLRSPERLRSYLEFPDFSSFCESEVGSGDSHGKINNPVEKVALDYLVQRFLSLA
jgi:hypothetical protein